MRRTAGLAVGAVILLAAAAGTGLASHRAFVKLSVPAQKVEVGLTLTGSHGSGDLPTQNLTVKVADTLAGSASMATINTYASGDVVFAWPCSPGSCPWAIRVYAGSDLWTRGGIHYQTLADVLWVPPAQSQPTPIRAVMPGPSGNTGPGTVVGLGSVWGNIGVTNPKAITGGSSREAHIISESDFSAVERAVLTEAINDANQAMRVKSAGMGYALIGGPSIIETSSDAVGDESQT